MRLVLLHGRPGVGKLTVGRELQNLTGFRLFHNHLTVDLVLSLFPFGSAPFAELRERIWLDSLKTAADAGVDGVIFTLVFEPTVPASFFDRLVSTVEERDGSVHPFELLCDIEENARRVTQPDRQRYLKASSAEFLMGGIEAHTFDPPPDIQGNIRIDTTHLSAQETAQRIFNALPA